MALHLKRWWLLCAAAPLAMLAAGASWQWTATRLETARFPPPGLLIDVGGRRLHLLCSGNGGPTVILEASGLGGALQYQALQRELARDLRVCAYDRAGLGWSDPSGQSGDARSLVGDLERLMLRARLEPPYLFVASSAGGLTVELYARTHPANVAGLVMLDALNARLVESIPEMQRLADASCGAQFAARFGLLRVVDPLDLRRVPAAERARAIAHTYRTSTLQAACALTSAFAQSAKQIGRAPPLPRTLAVSVIVHDDPVGMLPGATPAQLARIEPRWQSGQRAFAASVDNGEFVMAHSRHLIASEHPEIVVEAVRRLRARLGSAAAASPVTTGK